MMIIGGPFWIQFHRLVVSKPYRRGFQHGIGQRTVDLVVDQVEVEVLDLFLPL